jgi:myo-inositol-1(or 4)-monophosphatase
VEAIDIAELRGWAQECGAYARSHFNRTEGRRKADRSYVTDVDVEIERMLDERLAARYPDYGIVGEERGRRQSADSPYTWAIDPIDGTASFVTGLPIWGVSIGLLHNSRPYLGVFYMPMIDELYWNEPGAGAFFNGQPIQVIGARPWDSEDWISVPSNAHRRYTIDFLGKTRSLGSVVADLCYTARGSALGSLIGRCSIWDIAAGLAIVEAAGGASVGISGQQPDLKLMLGGTPLPEPMVVSGPNHLEALRSGIQYR